VKRAWICRLPTALPDLKMLDEQKTKQDRSGSNKDRDHVY